MKRILLTAYGLCTEEIKRAFYRMISENPTNLTVGIISTSQPELKEQHPQMISVKNTFHQLGFEKVQFVDIEFEDKHNLENFDIIFLNGGYPAYLLYHLKETGADVILNNMINMGKVVIGLSAGSMVLGPDNTLYNYLYPEANTFKVTDFTALNATDIRIFPHYKELCGRNLELKLDEKISDFERKFNCEVARLDNSQAILILGDNIETIG